MVQLPLVAITNRPFPETRASFEGVARIVANDRVEPWSRNEAIDRCRHATGVMVFMTDHIDAAFLDACPRLKVVGAALKGYDNIDVNAATARGVWVTVIPDLLTEPTAELAVGLTISLGRRIRHGDARIRHSGFAGWRPDIYGSGIAGSTVGIVGFGSVGRAVARCLSGFRCRIVAYDARPAPPVSVAVAFLALPELLRQSDVVVLGLPLTPATQGMIDRDAIRAMKRGALLVNPARGSLVDEGAVADALEAGHLGGYAADVFECEDWARPGRPITIEARLTAPDAPTVLTPHIGSAVESVRRAIELSAALSIVDALAGAVPKGAVNAPDVRIAKQEPV
jgi:phosphonate dehydrogenase